MDTFQVRSNHQITGFVLTGPDSSTFVAFSGPWQGDVLPSECFDDGAANVNTIDENGTGWRSVEDLQPRFTLSLWVNYGGEWVKLATI